jgi:isopropylmalate/homocitrate/citramalate synthase
MDKKLILFDVSLRDGLQGEDVNKYDTNMKQTIYDNIKNIYKPKYIELGSICSYSILPIFRDTIELYNKMDENEKKNIFILIANYDKFMIGLKNNVLNFSFITAFSETFQYNNTKQTLIETKNKLNEMVKLLNYTNKTKLYISCFGCCPYEGQHCIDVYVKEIIYYYENYNFREICLSDTMGCLSYVTFKKTMDKLKHINSNIFKYISLHLHVDTENIINLKNILFYCFDNNILKFDVSMINSGGCNITLNKEQMHNNLSYDLLLNTFNEYISNKIK